MEVNMQRHDHHIVGIHVRDRVKHAGEVQRVLTAFGKHIKTRIGLHDVGGGQASDVGLIIVEILGKRSEVGQFVRELKKIRGLDVKEMLFSHA
jgi:hypothetical protein